MSTHAPMARAPVEKIGIKKDRWICPVCKRDSFMMLKTLEGFMCNRCFKGYVRGNSIDDLKNALKIK